jgi:hypothetical protein
MPINRLAMVAADALRRKAAVQEAPWQACARMNLGVRLSKNR